ncbi:hypothetical protein [Tissierella sp.]|nr:hypothetical protein [Tissierella sp.]
MTVKEKNDLNSQVKDFMKKLESINEKDKDIILASLKGMLLVADIKKEMK